ncbi:hypothetical protein BKA70DRAFT_820821 [Coprinopsis sp. MPI-PUGE-AT-0042]|nr:hypothetical protein BKA70DRAFT_820821 [Coprinopsis sp. MPI-PUGE-AT-0042]
MITLLGASGCGKSSFVNALVGRRVAAVGAGLESTTTEVSEYRIPGDQPGAPDLCLVVDTPGFGNCQLAGLKSDCEILQEVERFLKTRHRSNGQCIIIVLHNAHVAEVNWEGQERTMAIFKRLADYSYANVVVVITSQHEGVAGTGESDFDNGLLKELRLHGATFVCSNHFDHVHSSCADVRTPRQVMEHVVFLAASRQDDLESECSEHSSVDMNAVLPEEQNNRGRSTAANSTSRTPDRDVTPSVVYNIHNSKLTNVDGDQVNYFQVPQALQEHGPLQSGTTRDPEPRSEGQNDAPPAAAAAQANVAQEQTAMEVGCFDACLLM